MAYKFKTMEKIVGAFVVLAILFLIAMIIMIGRGKNFFIEKNFYYTHYRSGAGIVKGSTPVIFNGMTIGNVTEVKLEPDNRIFVRFFIHREYAPKLKKNSVAVIVRPLLVGTTSILITSGTIASDLLPNNSYIISSASEEGARLLEEQKVEATTLIDTIGGNLNNLLASLGDPKGNLQMSLRTLTREVSNVYILNNNLNAISGNIAGNKNQINDIIISLQQASDNLAEITKNLKHNRLLGGRPEKGASPLSTGTK